MTGWRNLDEGTIRIDAWRAPIATQALVRGEPKVIVQIPVRTHRGQMNIILSPEMAAGIAKQLTLLCEDLIPADVR